MFDRDGVRIDIVCFILKVHTQGFVWWNHEISNLIIHRTTEYCERREETTHFTCALMEKSAMTMTNF